MAKKIYTQEELQARANDALKQFPTVNKVYATVDGNVFVDKNRAELHAGPKGRVLPFERTIEVAPREYDLNAKDTIAAIKATAKIEDLEAFKSDERKSVIEALEKRTAELSVPAEPTTPATPPVEAVGLGKDKTSPENREENTGK